jgi:hypothetical protein
MYRRQLHLAVVLAVVASGAAAQGLAVRSLDQIPGLETEGIDLTPVTAGGRGVLVSVNDGGGWLSIPIDDIQGLDGPGLRMTLEGQWRDGQGGAMAELLAAGEPMDAQPLWLADTWRATRLLWRVPESSKPEAVRLRFDGPAALVLGRATLGAAPHVLPEPLPTRRIPNGGFELGLAGWAPYGTTAPVVRLTDQRPGSGRWCAEMTTQPALLPIVFRSWPLPEVGVPEHVGMITRRAIELQPGQPYTISLLLRASQPGAGVDLGVYQDTGTEAQAHLEVSREWRPYVVHVLAEGRRGALWIRPTLDGSGGDTRLWVDDVALHRGRLEAAPRTRGSAPDVSLAPTAPNGVYGSAEPMTVVLRAVGFTAGADLPVTGEVRDIAEHIVHRFEVDLPGVPAGEVSERVLALPIDDLGFFRVTARWTEDEDEFTRDLRIARYAPYAPDDSPLGVSRGWDVNGPWHVARTAGVCWAREWIGAWDVAESEAGQRSLLTPISFAQRYRSLGYRLLACVPFPSARWEASVDEATWRSEGVFDFVGSRAYLPDDPGALPEHVASLAAGLGGSAQAIELLQEPLVSGWSMPSARYGPSDYVDLCRRTDQALSDAGWAGVLVGGAGAFPTDRAAETVTALAEQDLMATLDTWNAHAYLFGFPAEALASPAAALDAATAGAPIWVTELGIWGDDSPSALTPHRKGTMPSELAAADASVRAVAILLSHGAERVFFSARSLPCHAPGGGRDWLVTPAGQPRKALPVMAALAGLLGPGPRARGIVEGQDYSAYLFDTHTGGLAVVCPDYGHQGLASLDGVDTTILDLCGNVVAAPPEGDSAFYLTFPESEAGELAAMLRASPPGAE